VKEAQERSAVSLTQEKNDFDICLAKFQTPQSILMGKVSSKSTNLKQLLEYKQNAVKR
jgi:hypothetical protein